MTYLTEAHNRLLARLAKAAPTEISVNPSADEFDCQRAHIEAVAVLVDDYFHSLAIDAAQNSHRITPPDFLSVVSDAVHDASLGSQFTDAADELREHDDDADHHFKSMREAV